MKDSPQPKSKTSSGPMPTRRAGERYCGPCVLRFPARKSLLTPSRLRGLSASKRRSSALPAPSKPFKIEGMFARTVVIALLLAAAASSYHATLAQTPEETQAQIDATNQEIQRLKDEIAALQKDLNATTEQKQTLQSAIKQLDLQIQKLQKNVSLTTTKIGQK